MKVDIKTVGVESHGVKSTMQFGIGDASVVIDILRNRLYAHPIQALTQEYISNARDAHREVGSNRSVIITMPTTFSPVFKVRDFGPGVTPERYATVFVLYGASTKRADDVQTGGFGIGAKSAWSYADSFNVTTFVDGIRRDYVNHVGNKNEGEADLVNESPTDELNGTEIQVPVDPSDIYKFRDAIFRATYFWQDGCQFLGIDQNELPKRVGMEIEEGIELVQKAEINPLIGVGYYNKHLIVSLDGIPYPVEGYEDYNLSTLMDMLNEEYTAVVHLSTGDISVAASRDAISYDDDTIETLELTAKHVVETFRRYINKQIASVDSVSSFFNTYKELTSKFNDDQLDMLSLEYDAYRIKAWTVNSNLFADIGVSEVGYRRNRRQYTSNTNRLNWCQRDCIKLKHLDSRIYYVDVNESQTKISRRIKTALIEANEIASNNGRNITVLKGDLENMEALEQVAADLKAIPLSTIEMIAVEKRQSVKEMGEVVLHVFQNNRLRNNSRTRCRISLEDNETTYIYIALDNNKFPSGDEYSVGELSRWIRNLPGNMNLCGVSSRALKAVQDDDNFIPFQEWIDEFQLTDVMKFATIQCHIDCDTTQTLRTARSLCDLKVKDSEFTNTANELAAFLPQKSNSFRGHQSDALPEAIRGLLNFNGEQEAVEISDKAEGFRTMIQSYPLLSIVWGQNDKPTESIMDELVLYMDTKKEQNDLTAMEE